MRQRGRGDDKIINIILYYLVFIGRLTRKIVAIMVMMCGYSCFFTWVELPSCPETRGKLPQESKRQASVDTSEYLVFVIADNYLILVPYN